MFDPKLLEILVCPKARCPLVWDKQRNVLVSPAAQLAYPIVDGIAVLRIDLAQPLQAAAA